MSEDGERVDGRAVRPPGSGDDADVLKRRFIGLSLGLVYLFYAGSDMVTGQITGTRAVFAWIVLGVFILIFTAVPLTAPWARPPRRSTYLLLGALTVIAVSCPPLFSGNWFSLSIYVTVVYGMTLPPSRAITGMSGIAAIITFEGVWLGADLGHIALMLLQIVTLGFLFMSIRRTRLLVVQLREAQSEVARLAATEERLRIARDLHDLLGHSLSLIVLKSELAGRLSGEGSEQAAREIADIESVARKALVEVRETVTGYRRRGLAGELDGARSALDAAGIAVTVRTTGTPLPDSLDDLFGWAVREGATNVVRHAHATRCKVDVANGRDVATLEIADNGEAGPYQPGNGLNGLAERIRDVGGTIEAGPTGDGFRLRIAVSHELGADDPPVPGDRGAP